MSGPGATGGNGARRYFWGNTLRQALARAARQFQIGPDDLAWRPVDKRHGFVKQPRRVLIEVDPASPRRTGGRPEAPAASTVPARVPPAPVRPARAPVAEGALPTRREATTPARREAPPERVPDERRADSGEARPPSRRPGAQIEPPDPPDEESTIAASVAIAKLLRFSGLELEAQVEALPDRLEVRLLGPGEARLRELGPSILDDLGYLLPRLIKSLSGKHVLCRIDGAGLRDAREDELRGMARAAAATVLESGTAVILDPLPPGERRIVHLTLADDPRLVTESLGHGVEKRLRVAPATPGPRGPE